MAGTLRDLQTLFHAGAVGRLNDGELLRRFATRGEDAAFAVLVERHGPMVRRVCEAVLGDRHDAQDACQATFLILARRASSIRRADAVGSWLHGVACRVAARAKSDAARRRVRERHAAERASEAVDDGPPRTLWAELHEEIERLPEKYRAPIVLCGLEGRTHEEAAKQLRWPVGTVKVRLARGRRQLGTRLSRRGLAPSLLVLALAPAPSSAATAGAILRHVSSGAGAGSIPVRSVALAEAVSRSLLMDQLKSIAAALLTACAVTLIAASTYWNAVGAQVPPAPSEVKAPPLPGDRPDAARTTEGKIDPDPMKQRQDSLLGVWGNMRPLIQDEKGVRFQSREAHLYKDGTVKLWTFEGKEPICPPLRHEEPIREVTFYDEAGLLLTTSDASVKVWDGLTGAPRKEIKGQVIRPLFFTRMGANRFVTIDTDGRVVTTWDAKTLAPIGEFRPGGTPRLFGAALSPDGKTLMTIGEDRSVMLWDPGTGQAFATLRPPSALVARVFVDSFKSSNLPTVQADERFWKIVQSFAPPRAEEKKDH